MSIPHHYPDNDVERRLIDELFERARMLWPNGQIDPSDQGKTAYAIAIDRSKGVILIQFSQPMLWLGLDKKAATQLRDALTERINEL